MNALTFGQWMELSWAKYKQKLWEQLVIGGLGGAAGLLAIAVPAVVLALIWTFHGQPSVAEGTIIGLASVSAILWMVSWTQAAMMESALASEKLGWRQAYAVSWPKVAPFSWVCILWFLAISGGFFLFIIPAVVLSVSMAFAPYVCLSEGLGGLAALERSFFFVQGRWLFVLMRLIAIGAVLMLSAAVPMVGFILSALAAPFGLIASAVLYDDLKRTASAEGAVSAKAARGWLLAAAAGLCLMCVLGALSLKSLMSVDTGNLAAAFQQMAEQAAADPAKGQKLIDALQSGSTPATLEQAMSILQSSQTPAGILPQRP